MIVTLLIPCHNEEQALPLLLEALQSLPALLGPRHLPEILLVDDGSGDRTLQIMHTFAERTFPPTKVLALKPRGGLGAAIRAAAPLAGGEVVVTYDADQAYPLAHIPSLLTPIEEGRADLVTASPWHAKGLSEGVSLRRKLLSQGVSLLYRLRLGRRARGVKTFTCGFRAYRRELLQEILPRRNGFSATAELLVAALRLGARVEEQPSTLRARREGRSKLRSLPTACAHLGLLLRGR